jgi:KTSC domain
MPIAPARLSLPRRTGGIVKRVPIISSAIRSAGHDGGTLEIEFANGNLAWYLDVPAEVFRNLVRSPSPGRFHNEEIKGKYDCTNAEGVHTRAGQVEPKPAAKGKRGKKPGGAPAAPVRDLNPGYDPHGTKGVARARAARGLRVQRG